jgi:hypothetical protein
LPKNDCSHNTPKRYATPKRKEARKLKGYKLEATS